MLKARSIAVAELAPCGWHCPHPHPTLCVELTLGKTYLHCAVVNWYVMSVICNLYKV
jgi:hypothetical protein